MRIQIKDVLYVRDKIIDEFSLENLYIGMFLHIDSQSDVLALSYLVLQVKHCTIVAKTP